MESKARVVPESPVHSVAIRETRLGSYLESINSKGTWLTTIQEHVGITEPTSISLLDVAYLAAGSLGMVLLVPIAVGTGPVALLAVGGSAALVAMSAIGLNEPERSVKIGTGMALVTGILVKPSVIPFMGKQLVVATTET